MICKLIFWEHAIASSSPPHLPIWTAHTVEQYCNGISGLKSVTPQIWYLIEKYKFIFHSYCYDKTWLFVGPTHHRWYTVHKYVFSLFHNNSTTYYCIISISLLIDCIHQSLFYWLFEIQGSRESGYRFAALTELLRGPHTAPRLGTRDCEGLTLCLVQFVVL